MTVINMINMIDIQEEVITRLDFEEVVGRSLSGRKKDA